MTAILQSIFLLDISEYFLEISGTAWTRIFQWVNHYNAFPRLIIPFARSGKVKI